MRRLAALVAFGAAACGDGGGDAPFDAGPVSTTDGGECSKELAAFCGGPCPSFADSVAEVKRLAAGQRCFIAESGTCGSLRYTYQSSGFAGFQAWFDGAGKLLAARRFSDVPEFCDATARDEDYAAQPLCERTPTAMYCPR